MKKYLCIGGPLDGKLLTTNEVHEEDSASEYSNYNSSGCYGKPSMIRVHDSLLVNAEKNKTAKPWGKR